MENSTQQVIARKWTLSMRGYSLRRYLCLSFIIIYVITANYGPRMGRSEFYPFFNWSLFSRTHSVRYDIVLLVDGINGVKLATPTIYYYLPHEFVIQRGVRLRKMLYDLRRALRSGNEKTYRRYIKIIDTEYFRGVQSADLRIAVIRYNPIERLRSGTFEIQEIVSEISI